MLDALVLFGRWCCFLVVSGWFGVSSGSPFSGCLGERAVPFQLCQIGWCLRVSFRVVSFSKEFARVPLGTMWLFCGFVLLRISPCLVILVLALALFFFLSFVCLHQKHRMH